MSRKVDTQCDTTKPITYLETQSISFADYMYNTKNLLGKVLTVIDAVLGPVDDFEKNKATKDLIKGYFRTQSDRMYNVAGVDGDQELSLELRF